MGYAVIVENKLSGIRYQGKYFKRSSDPLLLPRLDDIISAKANDGSKGVERVLMDLFRRLNSTQIKWLVRIILKDLKLGLGADTILNVVRVI